MNKSIKKVAVIGAGPMGLAAAYYLTRHGIKTIVYEADDRLGGMSASFDFDDISIERYYHFINLPDKSLFDLLRELDMQDELCWQSTKMGFFRRDSDGKNRLHTWGNPLALLALSDIPLHTRLRYGFHAFMCKFINDLAPLNNVSASEWIRKWEGDAGYDTFWRFLFEKKFFELAEPLSAAWIASRIRRVANSRKSLMEEKLGYLQGGSESLLKCLEKCIVQNGGKILLSEPVKRIEINEGAVCGVHSPSGFTAFDTVISTAPLKYLPDLAPDLPSAYRDTLNNLQNIGCACALFRLRKKLTDNFWLNIDVPDWDIPGVIEYSNLRPMDRAYVYVPLYMPHSRPDWKKDDEALLEKARDILRGVNAEAAATEEAARLFRYEYAQPVCPPCFQAPDYYTGIKGFYAADTTHSFPEDRSINESVRIAREVVKKIF